MNARDPKIERRRVGSSWSYRFIINGRDLGLVRVTMEKLTSGKRGRVYWISETQGFTEQFAAESLMIMDPLR